MRYSRLFGLVLVVLCGAAMMVGCPHVDPTMAPTWGRINLDHYWLQFKPQKIEHYHVHEPMGLCPTEVMGVITFDNASSERFFGTLRLGALKEAGVTLSQYQIDLAAGQQVDVTAWFTCVKSGQFNGDIAVEWRDSQDQLQSQNATSIFIKVP